MRGISGLLAEVERRCILRGPEAWSGEATLRVTERTFYPALLKIISEKGGSGVTEVQYDTVPDIEFDFLGYRWLLSVKLGESPNLIKDAFVQYLRNKQESGVEYGLLLMLPDSIRKTKPKEDDVLTAIRHSTATVLVDAGPVKDEYRDRTFGDILDLLRVEVAPLIEKGVEKHYPLALVISLLRIQVQEVMSQLVLSEDAILRIVTDRKLMSNLGRLSRQEVEDVGRFLAAYIVLSQILFLRLFAVVHTDAVSISRIMTRARLRSAFKKILDINYRPIYELDVLDSVPDKYLRDTFDLIWGLAVERVRYELPGRIFHALMPSRIRKLLAAFYTRPQAAEILARLTIDRGDATVFDPASGSGTILVAAYRAKQRHFEAQHKPGNPHKRFCEDEIFGADIMPFAVHLTSANLAAMDVAATIERTQIIQGDSIELVAGKAYESSLQLGLFRSPRKAKTTSGEEYEVTLDAVDAVLMNPPFTKIERGIKKFVNMDRFAEAAGGEVGLWGHFIPLANEFLKDGGTFGAVLPINVLRGRESARVRAFLFQRWTPLYVLKPTRNYGFSEWAEYRDVLFIARKGGPDPSHRVKFCLVKKDLTALDEQDIDSLSDAVKTRSRLRSPDLDIDSHAVSDILPRSMNLMWFCGVVDFKHRDALVNFYARLKDSVSKFPPDYVREGYRSEQGIAGFLFLTRRIVDARVEEAFLHFEHDKGPAISAESKLGSVYQIERTALVPSVRTSVGLRTLDITHGCDYLARQPYREIRRVQRACGFKGTLQPTFWEFQQRTIDAISANLVTVRRVNPYSPQTHLLAFVSDIPLCPGDQFKSIAEGDPKIARAVCVLLNSCLFLTQFFLLREESTGRFLDIRAYDFYEMNLYPKGEHVSALYKVFEKYRDVNFPSLREQLDTRFDDRYEEFWQQARGKAHQSKLWTLGGKPVEPSKVRVEFDLDVTRALGVKVSEDELRAVYAAIVNEMIATRGLTKD